MSQCHHKHLIIQAFLLEPKSKTEVLMDKFHAEKFLRRNEPVTFPIKFSIFITFQILSQPFAEVTILQHSWNQ